MKKHFIVFLLCLVTVCFFGVFMIHAEEVLPTVYASDVEVVQGNSVSLTIRGSNFSNLAGIELFVYYDADVFTLQNQYTSGLLSGVSAVSDTETPGVAILRAVSLDAINGSGSLWVLTFRVRTDAPVGKSRVTVAVGEAYDTDLNPIAVSAQDAAIVVKQSPTVVNNIYFYASNPKSIAMGDATELYYYYTNGYDFASGDFEINYDKDLLYLESVTLGDSIKNAEGAIYSINTDTPGYIKISYAALCATSYANPFLKLRFRSLQNTEAQTEVEFIPGALYTASLAPLTGSANTTRISLFYIEPTPVYPCVSVADYVGYDADFTVDITAESLSRLAAADFILCYDTEKLLCTAVDKVGDYFLVTNPDMANGTVRFSFVFENGITEDAVIARLHFHPKTVGNSTISLSVNDAVNASFEEIMLSYRSGNIKISHEIAHYDAQNPDCTHVGWEAYDICKNCAYSTYKELPALGHNYKWITDVPATQATTGFKHEECVCCHNKRNEGTVIELVMCDHTEKEFIKSKAPTCTEDGTKAYWYCPDCKRYFSDEVCQLQIVENIDEWKVSVKLGHDFSEEWTIDLAPTCTEHGSKSHHCSRCSKKSDVTAIDSNGHSYGEWYVMISATHEHEGTERRDCKICGEYETRAIAKISLVSEFKAAVNGIEGKSGEELFCALKSVAELYNLLNDDEKREVIAEYETFVSALTAYNTEATAKNDAFRSANENVLLVMVSTFAWLGAVLWLIKRKYM